MNQDLERIKLNLAGYTDPRVLKEAFLGVYTEQFQRIFEDGLASSGSGIGSYSPKPIYVNPADSPKSFATKGKTGKTTFKNGSKHKTGYFQGGYKEFRNTIGRPTDVVNLQLTENMRKAWQPDLAPGRYVFGFTSQEEAEKAAGNERHFGKVIFDLTQDEKDKIPERILEARKKYRRQ